MQTKQIFRACFTVFDDKQTEGYLPLGGLRDADDGRVNYVRVGEDHVLQCGRGQSVACHVDHVVVSCRHVDVAELVTVASVHRVVIPLQQSIVTLVA